MQLRGLMLRGRTFATMQRLGQKRDFYVEGRPHRYPLPLPPGAPGSGTSRWLRSGLRTTARTHAGGHATHCTHATHARARTQVGTHCTHATHAPGNDVRRGRHWALRERNRTQPHGSARSSQLKPTHALRPTLGSTAPSRNGVYSPRSCDRHGSLSTAFHRCNAVSLMQCDIVHSCNGGRARRWIPQWFQRCNGWHAACNSPCYANHRRTRVAPRFNRRRFLDWPRCQHAAVATGPACCLARKTRSAVRGKGRSKRGRLPGRQGGKASSLRSKPARV